MFSTMFDLITVDYITEHDEYKENHASTCEPPKRGEVLPMFV